MKKGIAISFLGALVIGLVATSIAIIGYTIYANKGFRGYSTLSNSSQNLINTSINSLNFFNNSNHGNQGNNQDNICNRNPEYYECKRSVYCSNKYPSRPYQLKQCINGKLYIKCVPKCTE